MVQLAPKHLTTKGHNCCCFEVFPVHIWLYAWGLAGNRILLEFQVSWWLLYFAALIWPSSLKTFNRSLQHDSLWRWCISDFTLIFWHICIRDIAYEIWQQQLLFALSGACNIALLVSSLILLLLARWRTVWGRPALGAFTAVSYFLNYWFNCYSKGSSMTWKSLPGAFQLRFHRAAWSFFFFMVFHSADSFMLQSIESPWVHKSYLTSYLTQ